MRHLAAGRERWGYLLLVDEIQTGMYRTGPFVRSQSLDLTPDLLLLGKATTDMMFPFALTLYSDVVRNRLVVRGSDLLDSIHKRYDYEHGYKTVVNVLRQAAERQTAVQVTASGTLVAVLAAGLGSKAFVREIRVFGLLIGIELEIRRWPRRWLGKRLASLYLFSMLRHSHFPVLAGLCQYEPNVLKITPPLNASQADLEGRAPRLLKS